MGHITIWAQKAVATRTHSEHQKIHFRASNSTYSPLYKENVFNTTVLSVPDL